MEKMAVRQAKKTGGSIKVALTGFVKNNQYYKVESSDKKIVLSPIDI